MVNVPSPSLSVEGTLRALAKTGNKNKKKRIIVR